MNDYNSSIENIEHEGTLLALIVRNDFNKPGISFFTQNDFSQQLAYMNHPTGKLIPPHVHNAVPRNVHYTLEVLFIKKGILKVDFYTNEKLYLESRILKQGDVILLATGGHGFEVIENVEMIEVKQGPYAGDQDKTRFEAHVRKA
jgi:mannose-6-phosphate isomerase-like protein (cupin superfamily)